MMSAETLPWLELSAPRLDTQLATPWTANDIDPRPVASGPPACQTLRKLLKGPRASVWAIGHDKLSSYRVAHRAVMPSGAHSTNTNRYENNYAEVSHQPTRHRERHMRRFESSGQAQRFLSVHGLIRNLFHVGCYLVRAEHHRGAPKSLFSHLRCSQDRCLTRAETTVPSTSSLEER